MAARHRERDDLRYLVGMELGDPLRELDVALAGGLDDRQRLGVIGDRALPAIDRANGAASG